jgi:hypothetical protein
VNNNFHEIIRGEKKTEKLRKPEKKTEKNQTVKKN